MADQEHDNKEDRRPDVAKDDHPDTPTKAREKWHNPEETLDEAPAGSPNAEKRSRVSDG
jgi:hypothetical protein